MTSSITGWIVALFRDVTPVEAIRDEIFRSIGQPSIYTCEWLPHLSFFGTAVPEQEVDSFTKRLADTAAPFIGKSFEVKGFHVYPDPMNPMVIGLDPAVRITPCRSRVRELLIQHDGTVTDGPHPPHVTLFRAGDDADESTWGPLPDQVHHRLRQELFQREPTHTLTIDSIRLLRTEEYRAARKMRKHSLVGSE